jgi:hypothetical protein
MFLIIGNKILNSSIFTREQSMPIFRKIIFGTGGPSRIRPTPIGVIARPLVDTTLYIMIEDNSDWFITENDEPFILE